MALILSLDTTGEFGGVALLEDEQLLQEVPLHAPDGYGHILFGAIERLLESHEKTLGDVDCFAAASGPGSFTGVRVGLAAVKGLAEATGKPVAAVSNLKALAWFGAAPLRATLLDARRGEIYGAVYDSALQPILGEKVNTFADWIVILPDGDIEFICPHFAPFRPALAGTRFEDAMVVETPRSMAAPVARIAAVSYATGVLEDPVTVDANYVRRSDAERFWKDPVR